jgi:hypothetical protein
MIKENCERVCKDPTIVCITICKINTKDRIKKVVHNLISLTSSLRFEEENMRSYYTCILDCKDSDV